MGALSNLLVPIYCYPLKQLPRILPLIQFRFKGIARGINRLNPTTKGTSLHQTRRLFLCARLESEYPCQIGGLVVNNMRMPRDDD